MSENSDPVPVPIPATGGATFGGNSAAAAPAARGGSGQAGASILGQGAAMVSAGAPAAGGVSQAGSAGSSQAGVGGRPAPSSGCQAPYVAELQEVTVTVQGVERRFLAVPPSTQPAGELPVLVGYHGGGLGADNAADWGFTIDGQGSDGRGKAVLGLYPWGLTQGNGFTGWDSGDAGSADVELTEAMLNWAASHYCIDSTRVFAAGHSWGGWMATRIGCVRPALFRAVMSLGGGGPSPATDCKAPVAALIVHGKDDNIASVSDSQDSLATARELNGCSDTSTPKNAEQVECDLFTACQLASEPVAWCWYAGGHFPWPTSIVDPAWTWFETLP